MWRHYGIQPYVCEYCGRRFGQASNFARHKKKQHKNDIPKYPCLDPSCQSTLFETTEELRIHVQSSHPNFDPENLQVHLQNFSIEALSSTSPSPSPIENGARQASANSLRSHSPFSQSTIQEQFTPEVCLPQSQVPTTLMPKRPILVRQDSSFDVVMDSFLKTEQGLAIQNSIQELDFAPEEPLGLSRDNSLFQLGLID